jgi:iron complex outermembrane recepter protein
MKTYFRLARLTLFTLLLFPADRPLTAAPQTPTARLTGRVTDQQGQPLAGARVTARPTALPNNNQSQANSGAFAVTESNGNFTLSLPEGRYQMVVAASGFRAEQREVAITSSGLTLDVSLAVAPLSATVTVTAARVERRIDELPASVTVLDSRDVRQAGAQTVDDLLRQVPGFSIFRRSSSVVANPTTQGVSLRGAGATGASRTLVLSDGVPLNDAFGGWVYWDRVPRAALDQIEVVRGGNSDLYGSDALSGVISLNTRRAGGGRVNAEASYGTLGTADVSFFAGERFGNWAASVAGEAYRTDGYFVIAPEIRGLADEEAASEHRALTLRVERHFGSGGAGENLIYARGALFDEDRKNGTRLQRNDTATESLAVGTRFRTNDGSAWQAVVYANQQRFHQNFTAVAANRNSETLTREQAVPSRDLGLSLNWSRPFAERHLIVAGADARGVRGTSDEIIFTAGRATSFVSAGGRQRRVGFFAQDLWTITPRWQLTASVRYDNWRDSSAASVTRTLATGAVQPRFFAPRSDDAISPRLALLFRANEKVSLRAAAYRAFRAPTLNELYRAFRVGDTLTLANENLGPERLAGGEAGADFTPLGRLTLRTTAYWTEIDNPVTNFTLSVTPTLITRERRNLGRVRSRGVEFEADYRVDSFWHLSAGYLFADATVREAPQDARLVGLRVPQVPRHQFTLQTSYANPKYLTAAIQFRASGRQFDDDQNRLPLNSFSVLDATMSRRLNRWLEVFFAAQNVLDERYAVGRTPIETLGAPRLFRGGLRIRVE